MYMHFKMQSLYSVSIANAFQASYAIFRNKTLLYAQIARFAIFETPPIDHVP